MHHASCNWIRDNLAKIVYSRTRATYPAAPPFRRGTNALTSSAPTPPIASTDPNQPRHRKGPVAAGPAPVHSRRLLFSGHEGSLERASEAVYRVIGQAPTGLSATFERLFSAYEDRVELMIKQVAEQGGPYSLFSPAASLIHCAVPAAHTRLSLYLSNPTHTPQRRSFLQIARILVSQHRSP